MALRKHLLAAPSDRGSKLLDVGYLMKDPCSTVVIFAAAIAGAKKDDYPYSGPIFKRAIVSETSNCCPHEEGSKLLRRGCIGLTGDPNELAFRLSRSTEFYHSSYA